MFDFGDTGAFLPLQQSAPYAAAAAMCGARVRWLEGSVLAVERGRLRLISRVRGLDRAGLRQLARWPGITVATPEAQVAGIGLIPLVTPMHHAVWALGPELRAGMARNWRGHLHQAERAGLAGDARGCAHAGGPDRGRGGAAGRGGATARCPEGFSRALPQDALRMWEWRQAGADAGGDVPSSCMGLRPPIT
jgi:hypothetical protein